MAKSAKAAAQAVASPELHSNPGLVAPGEFEDFYREAYREVVKAAMIAGATREEAEDAASKTFLRMLERWPVDGTPLRYARTAVLHNFIQGKTRGTARVTRRLIERGHIPPYEGAIDAELSAREGREWIADVLSELSGTQREVMERIADGLTYEEIAEDLGRSREVVRRRLCDARARLVQILNPDGESMQPNLQRHAPPGRRPDDRQEQLRHAP